MPGYRVTGTKILVFGQRRVRVEATTEAGCPSCAVISTGYISAGYNGCVTSPSLARLK